MSTLPGNIATPTLVTGKTNKSQVVDVYAKSPVETKAQNMINSVLNSANGTVLESSKNAVIKILDSKRFYTDLGGIINKFGAGGFSKEALKGALKDYKKGALGTILEANGVKDLDSLKNNILGAVEGNVKNLAFGSVKGFVDTLSPGLLDAAGVKSFADAKKVYDGMDRLITDVGNMNTEAWLEQGMPFAVGLGTGALQASLDIISEILPTGKLVVGITDKELDNAILTGVTKDLIGQGSPEMNDFIFTRFGDLSDPKNQAKLEMFLSTSSKNAGDTASMDFIIKGAGLTSDSFIKANIGIDPKDFVSNIKFDSKFQTDEERLKNEKLIIDSLKIVSGKTEADLSLDMFTRMSKDGKEVLKYSKEWAASIAISEGLTMYDPMKLPDLYPDYF